MRSSLKDQRPLEELDDPRDQDALDALDDVCLVTAELCGLWDRLGGALGDGRPDTIPWVRRDFDGVEPETAPDSIHWRSSCRRRVSVIYAFGSYYVELAGQRQLDQVGRRAWR